MLPIAPRVLRAQGRERDAIPTAGPHGRVVSERLSERVLRVWREDCEVYDVRKSLEAAYARVASHRRLYGGAPDAAPGPHACVKGRKFTVTTIPDADGATAGSGSAAVQGHAAEPVVGRRSHVRCHVARSCT